MFELANIKNDWDWCYKGESSHNGHDIEKPSDVKAMIDRLVRAWDSSQIRPSHVYSVIHMCSIALDSMNIEYKNKEPVPLCYFSEIQTVGALLVNVYLRGNFIKPVLIRVKDQGDLDSKIAEWGNNTPKAIIFSFSAINYIDIVKLRAPELKQLNTSMYAGGVVFKRSNKEKESLSFLKFPSSLNALVKQLENEIGG